MISTVGRNLFEACSVLFRSLFGVRCLTSSQLRRMHHVNLKQICFSMPSLMAWKTGMAHTRGQMGFNDAVYNYIFMVPGL